MLCNLIWESEGVQAVCIGFAGRTFLTFATYLAGGLVVTQAEEARVAQQPGRSPFGESDLGYQLGGHPLNIAPWNGPF